MSRRINFRDELLFAGSCFSEHIAANLERFGFRVHPQPSGIVFNPVSLAKPFLMLKENVQYTGSDLIMQDLWHSKFHHGSFSGAEKNEVIQRLNTSQLDFSVAIKQVKFLFVTFGSAWVYRLSDTGEIVANCHKVPQSRFSKELLSVDDIVGLWKQVLDFLNGINPGLQVVFTVSPVKHLRDGVIENNISKSVLSVAIHELRKQCPADYFPAFELVSEDLRDYRFYEQDGAHPNAQAIQYVFEKFCSTCLDGPSLEYLSDMRKLRQSEMHRPVRTEGIEYEKFNERLSALKYEIARKYDLTL